MIHGSARDLEPKSSAEAGWHYVLGAMQAKWRCDLDSVHFVVLPDQH
jgi:hypothetical protein